MNRIFHKIFRYSILIIIVAALTSCATKQKISKKPLKEYGVSHLIKEVQANEFDFDRLQAKMSIDIKKDGSNINLKGQIRIDKDSVLWSSLSLGLGLEVARVKITQDSVFYISRTERTYLTEDLKILGKILPEITSLDFIQSVFIGNDRQINNGDDFKASVDGECYKLTIMKKVKKSIRQQDNEFKILVKDVWINPEFFKITKYNIKEFNDEKRKIQLEYADFILIGDKYIPTKIICTIQGDKNIKISIEYSNIVINNDLEFPFNIPSKYDRVKKW